MLEIATATLIGNRKLNQDRCATCGDERCYLLLLSDGLGGHPKGEVAAQILIDTGKIAFSSCIKPISNPQEFLDRILRTAHNNIIAFGNKFKPPINPKSTAVLALIQGGKVFWQHIGDSRLYLFREHKIVMRTRDHSVVEAMGINQEVPQDESVMRYRNLVTRCLGGVNKEFIDTVYNDPIALQSQDVLLLCTDGLWSQFSEKVLGLKMLNKMSIQNLASELAQSAYTSANPRSDNITLIITRWLGSTLEKN